MIFLLNHLLSLSLFLTHSHRSENPFLQFSFHDISSNSLLNETLTTSTTQSPLTNNRIDRQDRNAKSSNKSTFDPLKVYKRFGDMTNSSMRIIVHGFGSNCRHEWIDEMRAALMAVEECFVMCVQWEKGAILPKQVLQKLIQFNIQYLKRVFFILIFPSII
jgi:Lipase